MAKSPFEIELSEEEARGLAATRRRTARCCGRRSCCSPPREGRTRRSPGASTARCGRCRCGGNASSRSGWRVSLIGHGLAVRGVFPPEEVARVKAIACELPRTEGVPLSRFSRAELHRLVVERGVCEASASTIARWLREDALKPWQHRSWIFPTDPAGDRRGRGLADA